MKKLSEAELEIMYILWGHGKPLTSNQILSELEGKRNWKLASVMTVLARMAEKGAVYCDRNTRTNYYSTIVTEDEYKLAESDIFLERLYDKSAKNMIACLYNGKRMSKENIQELREYLNSLEEE